MTARPFRIATLNMHKGISHLNGRVVIHELKEELRLLNADIVFLQEVQGLHLRHAERHGSHWPEEPQHEFLARDHWHSCAYGCNVAYDHGHHGNAILSRFPLIGLHNQDVTHLRFERRGVLHCQYQIPEWDTPLHCVCVHLSLFGRSRRHQMDRMVEQIERWVPETSPLIVAGDFNDWSNRADTLLARRLGLSEVFHACTGRIASSFPSFFPLLTLDRIYVRGLDIQTTGVHSGPPWSRISDHAALSCDLSLPPDKLQN